MNDSTSIDAKMLVDSGASHGIYLQTNSDPRIIVPEKNVPSIIGRGIGGVITGRIARIKELDMAQFNLPDVIASFPDPNTYIDTLIMSNSIFRNGSIGGEVLSRFTVTFNFPKERMYLKKNSEFKKDFYFNLSGLTVRAKGSRLKNFEVSDVRVNSAAYKAGVKKGDRILGVNGMQAMDLDLNLINTYLNNKPGKKITLQIERAGEKQKIQFRLENMI
jgi:membrane-associated protease RseP (regulator of RpoE activity)